jgi:hypothetical protein
LFRPLTRSVAITERELTIQNARETVHLSWRDLFSVDVAEQPRRVAITMNEGRVVELEATRRRKDVDEIADRIRSEAQTNRCSL